MADAAELLAIAGKFQFPAAVASITELGSGNVNDTYLLTLGGGGGRIVLQRLNHRVFPRPALIMANLRTVSDHVARRLAGQVFAPGWRWEMPRIFKAADGSDFVLDRQGGCWRAISYIDNGFCPPRVTGEAMAREAGRALGLFHRLLSDLDPRLLHETLPGFHVTPGYLRHYDAAKGNCPDPRYGQQIDYCREFIEARRSMVLVLEEARCAGRLALRTIHGDPKIENIMIDSRTGRAIAMIDLDTVQPGLIHYDLGDCLRSCCNPLGEETADFEQVFFDMSLCRAILDGYLADAASFLMEVDYEFIYEAIRLIAFELGLRFFTDFLAGDRYFKVARPAQNLARALAQFALTASIEAQEEAIRHLVAQCHNAAVGREAKCKEQNKQRGCPWTAPY